MTGDCLDKDVVKLEQETIHCKRGKKKTIKGDAPGSAGKTTLRVEQNARESTNSRTIEKSSVSDKK